MSLEDLIRRIQSKDDESAFNELYLHLVTGLDDYAYRLLNDRETSEEVVNDVFVNIWKRRKQIASIKNIKNYLTVSVKNRCLNHLRNQSCRQVNDGEIEEGYYYHLTVDPGQIMISKEVRDEILTAVNGLPKRCKLIFTMVKVNDLSCKQAASILGLSDKTVFAQLTIALKKIEKSLLIAEARSMCH